MSTRESGKVCMAKLARIAHRLADLDAERAQLSAEQAKVFNELADGETVDLTTGKRLPRERQITIPPIDPETRAKALQSIATYQARKKIRA